MLGSCPNIKKLHREMNEARENGSIVTLSLHLQGMGIYQDHSSPIDKYLYELDINPQTMTVSQLLAHPNKDLHFLLPEIFATVLQEGLLEDRSLELLIANRYTQRGAGIPTQPYVNFSGIKKTFKKGEEVAPGTEFRKDSITWRQKSKDFDKFGKVIDIPYEVIEDCTINQLVQMLQGYTTMIFADRGEYIIYVLLNGDQAKDHEGNVIEDSAAVVGVLDTDNGLTYEDLLNVGIRSGRLGRPTENLVGDETLVRKILQTDEYKKREEGTPLVKVRVHGNTTTPNDFFISDDIGTGKALLTNKKFAVNEFIKKGITVETDKIIRKEIETAKVSMRSVFMSVFRNARIVIDESKDFSSDGFPSYFDIPKGKD